MIALLVLTAVAALPAEQVGAADPEVPEVSVGENKLVSVGATSAETNEARTPAMSRNGRYAVFRSSGNALYWRDLQAPGLVVVNERITGGTSAATNNPVISDNGCLVAFESGATDLVAGDTNGLSDVFVRDMCNGPGPVQRVSLGPGGAQTTDEGSSRPSLSGDGTTIAFYSGSSQLVPGFEMPASPGALTGDVFVRQLSSGSMELVSNLPSYITTGTSHLSGNHFEGIRLTRQALNEDGSILVFGGAHKLGPLSPANCDASSEIWHAYSYEVGSSAELVRVFPRDAGCRADPVISADGSTVVVRSEAEGGFQAASPTGSGSRYIRVTGAPKDLRTPWISENGGRLGIQSSESTLVPNDTNNSIDVFTLDWPGGKPVLVAKAPNGDQANGNSSHIALSAGQTALYGSRGTNLVPIDTSSDYDYFVRGLPPVTGQGLDGPRCCSGYDNAPSLVEDPVEAASGNLIDTTTDVSGPPGTTLSFTRTYNSFDERNGLLGTGWSTLADVTATPDGLSEVEIRLEDGRRAMFAADGNGGWTRPERLDASLTQPNGDYALSWDDGRVWAFDQNGRLSTVTSPTGEQIAIGRGPGGRLETMTATAGSTQLFQLSVSWATGTYPWQDGALPNAISTSDGRTMDLHFTPSSQSGPKVGLLTRFGNPRPSASAPWSEGWWQYSHDIDDRVERMERTVDAAANPTATSVRTRLKVLNTYDDQGRVATQTSPDGSIATFTYDGSFTTVSDSASGDETTYESDDDGKEVGVTDATRAAATAKQWNGTGELAETTDRSGATTRLLYDEQRRLRVRLLPDPATGDAESPDAGLGETWSNVGDWATRYESFDYDTDLGPADSRVTEYRNAAGEVTTYGYDGTAPRPSTVTTAAGTSEAATTTMTYATGAAAGQVKTSTTPEGIVTDYTYDPATGDLTAVTAGGRVTGMASTEITDTNWDGAWTTAEPSAVRAEQVTAPGTGPVIERTTTTLHGPDGRVLRTIDPLAATGAPGSLPSRTVYDDLGTPVSTFDQAGEETTYDTRMVTDRFIPRDPDTPCGCGPDPAWAETSNIGQVSTVTDPDGVVTVNKFSLNGDLIEERVQDGSAEESVMTHEYGRLGRLEQTTVAAGTAANPITEVTTYGYDANGNVTATTAGATLGATDRTTTTAYDKLGRVTEELGPQGDPQRSHVTYTYDLLGRKLTQVNAASDSSAKVMTTWRYDAAGRVVETVMFLDGYADTANPYPALSAHPDALVTRTSYDADGRTITQVEGPPNVQTHAWPATETPAQLDAIGPSNPRRVTRSTYDPVTGDLKTTTRPDQTIETRTYDPAGRVHEITETAAPPTSGTPATRLVARYDYDLANRIEHEWSQWVDPTGTIDEVVVDRTWTPTGQLKSETDPHLDGAPSGDIVTRSYTYTPAGHLETVLDPLGHKTSYKYEKGQRVLRQLWNEAGTAVESQQTWAYTRNGQVQAETLPHAPGDPSPPTTTFTYDDQGRLTQKIDGSGRIETTSYTNTGQPATITWATGASDPSPTSISMGYDGAGRRTSGSGAFGTYAWAYDRAGHLTSSTRPGPSAQATDQGRWDLAGNRTWYRNDNGRRLRYDWDKLARLSAVYVDLATEPSQGFWVPMATYGRSGFGDTVRETMSFVSGAGQRLWTRDLTGRIVTYDQTVNQSSGPPTTTSTALTWRPDGRLATEATTGDPTWAYDYDAAGQLIEADPSTGATLEWDYGTSGQREAATDGAGTTTYDWDAGQRRLDGTTGPTGTTTFGYDDAGRRTNKTTTPPGGSATSVPSSYDDRGRLASTGTGSGTFSRTYDLDGRVVGATSAVGTSNITWDPTGPIDQVAEFKLWGQILNIGMGESRLWMDYPSTSIHWYAYDVHGSNLGTTDIAGPASYDPWGNGNPAATSGFGYRGEMILGGLLHLRNRDYDTTTATFTTPDPLDSVDGTPTVGNGYHYADNDPLNKADPLGLKPTDPDFVDPCPSQDGSRPIEELEEIDFFEELGVSAPRQDSAGCVSLPEREGVVEVAVCESNPIECYIAALTRKVAEGAEAKYWTNFPSSDLAFGPPNAVKHMMWSGMMAMMLGRVRAEVWLYAHEVSQPGTPQANQMDRANNFYGLRLVGSNCVCLSLAELAVQIYSGELGRSIYSLAGRLYERVTAEVEATPPRICTIEGGENGTLSAGCG